MYGKVLEIVTVVTSLGLPNTLSVRCEFCWSKYSYIAKVHAHGPLAPRVSYVPLDILSHTAFQMTNWLVLVCDETFSFCYIQNKMFQVKQPDGTYKGLAFDIMDELALLLNFTWVLSNTCKSDGSFNILVVLGQYRIRWFTISTIW